MGIQLDKLGYIALRFVKVLDVNRKKIVIIALYIMFNICTSESSKNFTIVTLMTAIQKYNTSK